MARYIRTREATRKLLEMVDEGIIDPRNALCACLNYMSEADVADMCRSEEYFYDEDEDEDET